ncbi:MAG: hypothetical protein FWD55_07875 [Propionibacteriaceae bacterium]|nr:hypothetical protein [Propionibacteriaceae bacterium]
MIIDDEESEETTAHPDKGLIIFTNRIDAIRARPGVYLEACDHRGVATLVELLVKFAFRTSGMWASCARTVTVEILEQNCYRVIDDGAGIPVLPDDDCPAPLTEVFTILPTGVSIGGLVILNAFSERLIATVSRDGSLWSQEFCGNEIIVPLHRIGDSDTTGTVIKFWPSSVFTSTATGDNLEECFAHFVQDSPGMTIEVANPASLSSPVIWQCTLRQPLTDEVK